LFQFKAPFRAGCSRARETKTICGKMSFHLFGQRLISLCSFLFITQTAVVYGIFLLNFEKYITLKWQAAGLVAVSVTITHPSLPVAPPQPTPSVCRLCPHIA
jgi:hypothetical protein